MKWQSTFTFRLKASKVNPLTLDIWLDRGGFGKLGRHAAQERNCINGGWPYSRTMRAPYYLAQQTGGSGFTIADADLL
jgi:hypothetical protein